MRMTSERVVISSENTATCLSASTAALRAMFSVSAVFPIDGRAAMITRSPGCRPPVILSNSLKPVEQPVSSPPRVINISMWLNASCICSSSGASELFASACESSKILLSA